MKTIPEGLINFKSFERIIFEIMCQIACELIQEYLEWRDKSIMALRDTKEYRYIDKRNTTVKTVMGEVPFSRVYYRKKSGGYVFLLDDLLGLDCGCGLVSENLAEQIVANCSDKSFRKAASDISEFTGQGISRMGAWNVFQRYGEVIRMQETRLQELVECGVTGCLSNVASKVLFKEFDDIWISLQKEKRRKRGTTATEAAEKVEKKPGKKPMHAGTAYTGWSQAKDGSYSTVDKLAYAAFSDVDGFISKFESLLNQYFDMDGVERQVSNGDGESWFRTEAEATDSILQLDPYHRSEAIIKAVGDKYDRKLLFDAIDGKDVEKVLDRICDLMLKAEGEKPFEKLVKLYNYYSNNKDIFLTWQERGIELPAPPKGIAYRNLGTQESSNCNLITQRMKHRKGSWSKKGANNMAKILCFKNTIGLDTIMGVLPEPPSALPWVDPLSAAKAPAHDGKGYGADWLYAQMPFEKTFRTHGREAIRGMLRMKPLSQLAFH